MKKIFNITLLSLLATWTLVSCKKESLEYDGPVQVHFTEQTGTFFVEEDSDETFQVNIGLTKPASQDLTFTVTIEAENEDVEEGVEYSVSTTQLTIPAGEVIATIDVSSDYEALTDVVKLKFTLDEDEEGYNAIFNQEYNLTIRQFCPFEVEDFVGTYLFYDAWFNAAVLGGAPPYEVDAILHDSLSNTIVLIEPYDDGMNINITFDASNKSNFKVIIPDQSAWFDGEYGIIESADNEGGFDACERTISYTNTHLVPGLGWFEDNNPVFLQKID